MNKEIVPLGFDMIFKRMFGNNEEIERLEELLSIYFDIPVKHLKGKVRVINNDKILEKSNDKKQTVDILANIELISGSEKVNIEVNFNEFSKGIIDRNLVYASNILSNQLKRKQDYTKIQPVIQINFSSKDVDKDTNEIIDKYYLMNHNNYLLTNKLQIHNINIVKCYDVWYNKNINKYNSYEQNIIRFGALMRITKKDEFINVWRKYL